MASSRKSKSSSIKSKAEDVLRQRVRRGDRLAAALSGGIDSVVLLHLLVPLSAAMGFRLSAIHVDHGISGNAGKWSAFCRDLCHGLGILLETAQLKIGREPGASLEAAARDGRYQVFASLQADYVVLAHNQDDQAETLLLQLLRGAGVKGLAAMPVIRDLAPDEGQREELLVPEAEREFPDTVFSRNPPKTLRPLLHVSRREIEGYARENGLRWIVDESNEDVSFDRNFLRREVFPLLETRFPAYRATFSRAGRHMAEAAGLLDELAETDSGDSLAAEKLHIEDLRRLSLPRARNLLRYTLARRGAVLPSTVKLDDILRQLLSSRCDANPRVIFGDIELRCFRGLLYLRKVDKAEAGMLLQGTSCEAVQPPATVAPVTWRGESELYLPHLGGILSFNRENRMENGAGMHLAKLTEQPVTIRMRRGGERLRPDCSRPRRSLKNLLREAALPPWERGALPLIFSGDHLVCVPGIGIDCSYQATAGEPGLAVEWRNASGEDLLDSLGANT
jgi:tRNA(Ile)-lysidine synthase